MHVAARHNISLKLQRQSKLPSKKLRQSCYHNLSQPKSSRLPAFLDGSIARSNSRSLVLAKVLAKGLCNMRAMRYAANFSGPCRENLATGPQRGGTPCRSCNLLRLEPARSQNLSCPRTVDSTGWVHWGRLRRLFLPSRALHFKVATVEKSEECTETAKQNVTSCLSSVTRAWHRVDFSGAACLAWHQAPIHKMYAGRSRYYGELPT